MHSIIDFKEVIISDNPPECPRSCEVQTPLVLKCKDAHSLDAVQLAICLTELEDILIVDLQSTQEMCNCILLDIVRETADSNVVTFTSENCGVYLITSCDSYLPQDVLEMSSRDVIAGLVIDQQDPHFYRMTEEHLERLWHRVNSLEEGKSKDDYRKVLLDATKGELMLADQFQMPNYDRILPFMKFTKGMKSPLFENSGWNELPSEEINGENSDEGDLLERVTWTALTTTPESIPVDVSSQTEIQGGAQLPEVIEIVTDNKPVTHSPIQEPIQIVSQPNKGTTQSKPRIQIVINQGRKPDNISVMQTSPTYYDPDSSANLLVILGATFFALAALMACIFIWTCSKSKRYSRRISELESGDLRRPSKADEFLRKLSTYRQRKAYEITHPDTKLEEETARLLEGLSDRYPASSDSVPGRIVTSRVQGYNADQQSMHDMWLRQNAAQTTFSKMTLNKPRTMAEIQEQVRMGLREGDHSEPKLSLAQQAELCMPTTSRSSDWLSDHRADAMVAIAQSERITEAEMRRDGSLVPQEPSLDWRLPSLTPTTRAAPNVLSSQSQYYSASTGDSAERVGPTDSDMGAKETTTVDQSSTYQSPEVDAVPSDPWLVDSTTAWVEYSTRPEPEIPHSIVLKERPDIPKTKLILEEQEMLREDPPEVFLKKHRGSIASSALRSRSSSLSSPEHASSDPESTSPAEGQEQSAGADAPDKKEKKGDKKKDEGKENKKEKGDKKDKSGKKDGEDKGKGDKKENDKKEDKKDKKEDKKDKKEDKKDKKGGKDKEDKKEKDKKGGKGNTKDGKGDKVKKKRKSNKNQSAYKLENDNQSALPGKQDFQSFFKTNNEIQTNLKAKGCVYTTLVTEDESQTTKENENESQTSLEPDGECQTTLKIKYESLATLETEDESQTTVETEDETQTTVETEAESQIPSNTEGENQTTLETEDQGQTTSETEDESQTTLETEDESQITSESESQTTLETEDESQTTLETEDESQTVLETEDESQNTLETEDESQTTSDTEDTSQTVLETEDESQNTLETEDESQTTSDTEDKSQNTLETEDESQTTSDTEDKRQNSLETEDESQTALETQDESQSNFETEDESQTALETEDEGQTTLESEDESQTVLETEEESQNTLKTEVESQITLETEDEYQSTHETDYHDQSTHESEDRPQSTNGSEEQSQSVLKSDSQTQNTYESENQIQSTYESQYKTSANETENEIHIAYNTEGEIQSTYKTSEETQLKIHTDFQTESYTSGTTGTSVLSEETFDTSIVQCYYTEDSQHYHPHFKGKIVKASFSSPPGLQIDREKCKPNLCSKSLSTTKLRQKVVRVHEQVTSDSSQSYKKRRPRISMTKVEANHEKRFDLFDTNTYSQSQKTNSNLSTENAVFDSIRKKITQYIKVTSAFKPTPKMRLRTGTLVDTNQMLSNMNTMDSHKANFTATPRIQEHIQLQESDVHGVLVDGPRVKEEIKKPVPKPRMLLVPSQIKGDILAVATNSVNDGRITTKGADLQEMLEDGKKEEDSTTLTRKAIAPETQEPTADLFTSSTSEALDLSVPTGSSSGNKLVLLQLADRMSPLQQLLTTEDLEETQSTKSSIPKVSDDVENYPDISRICWVARRENLEMPGTVPAPPHRPQTAAASRAKGGGNAAPVTEARRTLQKKVSSYLYSSRDSKSSHGHTSSTSSRDTLNSMTSDSRHDSEANLVRCDSSSTLECCEVTYDTHSCSSSNNSDKMDSKVLSIHFTICPTVHLSGDTGRSRDAQGIDGSCISDKTQAPAKVNRSQSDVHKIETSARRERTDLSQQQTSFLADDSSNAICAMSLWQKGLSVPRQVLHFGGQERRAGYNDRPYPAALDTKKWVDSRSVNFVSPETNQQQDVSPVSGQIFVGGKEWTSLSPQVWRTPQGSPHQPANLSPIHRNPARSYVSYISSHWPPEAPLTFSYSECAAGVSSDANSPPHDAPSSLLEESMENKMIHNSKSLESRCTFSAAEVRMALEETDTVETDLFCMTSQSYSSILDEVTSELEFQMVHSSTFPNQQRAEFHSSADSIHRNCAGSVNTSSDRFQNSQAITSVRIEPFAESTFEYLDPLSSLPCTATVLPSTSSDKFQ